MRPNKVDYFLNIAKLVSTRATCSRRKVGCVLINEHNHIIATGYNGVGAGMPHCEGDNLCPGAQLSSGSGLDQCQAIHAEQNALLQCRDVQEIKVAFCTTKPCIHCMKMLLNTSCEIIIYDQDYGHNTEELWTSAGRKIFGKEEAKQLRYELF